MEEKKTHLKTDNTIEWGGCINEFLWICAGVNRRVLRQCPTEYAKYAGMGGTILFTAIMAALSGGYAISYVFNNTYISIAFGLFWGMLIFNLDRLIVNTMYSDGKVTISRREFFSGLPRIIMAIFLGIVISTPLEMKIFEDRINSQLREDNINRTNEQRAVMYDGIKNEVAERNKLADARKEIQDRLAEAERELKNEASGDPSGSGKVGEGPVYEAKKRNKEAIEKELIEWDKMYYKQLMDNNKKINSYTEKQKKEIDKGLDEDGFCIRYEAFSNVTKKNLALNIVSIMIMLLFIIIETAPTFLRMMVADGSYEKLLNAEKHRYKVLSDKSISDINDEINTEVQISTQKNKERLEAEVLANKELMERIAKAQAELLQTAIDKWREEELAKINENPSAYIKTNNAT